MSSPRILGCTFRANPEYQVVLTDRLDQAEQDALRASDHGRDLYGMLLPQRGTRLDPQAISMDTALLLFTLADPGSLPRYVLDGSAEDAEASIRRLVFDGVLEVLHEGSFLSGPRAAEMFSGEGFSSSDGTRTHELAVAALRYGQELTGLPQTELGLRLYFYGRQPVSPELRRRFGDEREVATRLGLLDGGPIRHAFDASWAAAATSRDVPEHWWQWRSASPAEGRVDPDVATYKLYVSPSANDLRAALEVLADALPNARGVTGFKIGAGLTGMCRPDKVIVYFANFDDLRALAHGLEVRLTGCAPHGVPFTAAVTSDGLLSWGADPPSTLTAWPRPTSWRMWIAERLAEHLSWARSAESVGVEAWRFALDRLRLDGIDSRTWIPASMTWPRFLGG